jgi:hypothetical protein
MLKKSSKHIQLDIFSSPSSLFSGKVQTEYENPNAWHNLFCKEVTMRINEGIFSPLFSDGQGRPNASIRVLIGMMILKEADGLSDEKIFENCRYNLLYRSALGLINLNDNIPTESTYYLFRQKIAAYDKEKGKNLIEEVFTNTTKEQCIEFAVSGKKIRMDSKLLGSNIAWLSRYELIHNTLEKHYKQIKDDDGLHATLREKLEEALEIQGSKVVYTHTNQEVKSKLVGLGTLIWKVLEFTDCSKTESYKTLQRVFSEQYEITEDKVIIAKDKESISAQSVQSPHDTDCTYRNKGGHNGQKKQEIKGYSINVTETCDDDSLNLLTSANVEVANNADNEFLIKDTDKTQKVVTEKIVTVYADGAYHSPANQNYCKENEINLCLQAIQGSKGRYELEMMEDQTLQIRDTKSGKEIENIKLISKNGNVKWRIKEENNIYRYITQKQIDNYQIRKKIEGTSQEEIQRRNNVEATIFQLSYHYSNAKSRYRGLTKHQMWASIRCLWVNYVRIANFVAKNGQNFINIALNFIKSTVTVHIMYQMVKNINQEINILTRRPNCHTLCRI